MPEHDPFDKFVHHNSRHVDFESLDKELVRSLDRDFPDISAEPYHFRLHNMLPGWLDERHFDKTLYMIGRRARRCKWQIITSKVLYRELEKIVPKIQVKGLHSGKISEEDFQKLVFQAGEEYENPNVLGIGTHMHYSEIISDEFAKALTAIPALWDHLSYVINDFYNARTDRCDIWKILNHPKVKKGMRQLREHIRFNNGTNPYERVLRLRNVDQHREDVGGDVHSAVYGLMDLEVFERNEAKITQYLDDLGNSYKHFAKGYGIMIEQMKKDAREMKDKEIFGKND